MKINFLYGLPHSASNDREAIIVTAFSGQICRERIPQKEGNFISKDGDYSRKWLNKAIYVHLNERCLFQ